MTTLEKLKKQWIELLSKPDGNPKSPEWLSEYRADLEKIRKQLEVEYSKEYQGLIEELSILGIQISSVYDLVNTNMKYPQAIKPLLKYLPLVKESKNKEGIVRALTVPEAKGLSVPILVDEYLKLPVEEENLKWVIGNAVNSAITKADIDLIIPIILKKENGYTREMFVAALGKFKTEKTRTVLEQLIHDDSDKCTQTKALKALKKFTNTPHGQGNYNL